MTDLSITPENAWLLQILKLARPWAEEYRNCLLAGDLTPIKAAFKQLDSPAAILSVCHHYLVGNQSLMPLERCTLPVKREYWEEAKQWAPGASRQKTKQISQAIYTMAFILQNDLL